MQLDNLQHYFYELSKLSAFSAPEPFVLDVLLSGPSPTEDKKDKQITYKRKVLEKIKSFNKYKIQHSQKTPFIPAFHKKNVKVCQKRNEKPLETDNSASSENNNDEFSKFFGLTAPELFGSDEGLPGCSSTTEKKYKYKMQDSRKTPFNPAFHKKDEKDYRKRNEEHLETDNSASSENDFNEYSRLVGLHDLELSCSDENLPGCSYTADKKYKQMTFKRKALGDKKFIKQYKLEDIPNTKLVPATEKIEYDLSKILKHSDFEIKLIEKEMACFWYENSIVKKITTGCMTSKISDSSGIHFFHNTGKKKDYCLKIRFEISPEMMSINHNRNMYNENLGWIHIPFVSENKDIIFGKQFLKEEKSISFKVKNNQIYSIPQDFKIVENENLYLVLNVKQENPASYDLDLFITRTQSFVNSQKNIILIEILKKQIYFSQIYLPIQIKLENNINSIERKCNLKFIQQGINFYQRFSVDKKSAIVTLELALLNDSCLFTTVNHKVLDINNLFNSSANSVVHRLYYGKKLQLIIDNAELVFPCKTLNEDTVISIQRLVSIEKEKHNVITNNLIKCLPDELYFLNPVSLKMRSAVENPEPHENENELIKLDNKIFEQKIYHFCKKGIKFIWNSQNKYKQFYYYFEKTSSKNVLSMVITFTTVSIKEVILLYFLTF